MFAKSYGRLDLWDSDKIGFNLIYSGSCMYKIYSIYT